MLQRLFMVDDGYIYDPGNGTVDHIFWAQELYSGYEWGFTTPMFDSKEKVLEYIGEYGCDFPTMEKDNEVG